MLFYELRTRNKIFQYFTRKYANSSISKQWQSIVGLEVHAQILSNSKLFSGAPTEFASEVNNSVSLFDSSIPGTLPVLNKRCVEAGILTALCLNCKVNPVSLFDRKHYFYGDIPAGYQITQQRSPLANKGFLQFQVYTPGIHRTPYTMISNIKQLQLEQDSGKSLHEGNRNLIDLNRAGVPLMELVFEPDLHNGEEAACLVKELIIILQRIGSCSCKMEEGALRVDANVSVHKKGQPLGTRTEIKNIGSVRGVAGAIKYEIERQKNILENGGTVSNETRTWDANNKITLPMRDKEQQQDYRYMPEPNLPPLHVALGPIERGCIQVNELQKRIPELPEQTRIRLKDDIGLTSEQAIILVNESTLLSLFTDTISCRQLDAKYLANIIINDFLALVNKEKVNLAELSLNFNHFGEAVELLRNNIINRSTAQLIFLKILQGNSDPPSKIVMEEGWEQINNEDQIRKICETVILENSKVVKQYKEGKIKVFNSLLGVVSRKTNNRSNMRIATKVMKQLLDE